MTEKKANRRPFSSNKTNIILVAAVALLALLSLYLFMNPIQDATGQYEVVAACEICPAFSEVEIVRPNFIYAYVPGVMAIILSVYFISRVYRNKTR